MYLTTIRPILEYGVQVCQDIPAFLSDKLGMVQKRALLIIYLSLGYADALSFSQITRLATRRNQLCTKYNTIQITFYYPKAEDTTTVTTLRQRRPGPRAETICNTKASTTVTCAAQSVPAHLLPFIKGTVCKCSYFIL